MKRYLISTVAVLVVLAVVLAAFGQQEKPKQGDRQSGRQGRGGSMSGEERQKAIQAIEEQLAKLKKEAEMPRPQGNYQDLSEEERTKLRERMTKVFQERQKTIDAIVAQVAKLQGQRQPEAEGVKYFIVSTSDLKPIQESAAKEKAKETSKLLETLVARASGQRRFGGRPPGSTGQRPQGGQRGGQGGAQRGERGSSGRQGNQG